MMTFLRCTSVPVYLFLVGIGHKLQIIIGNSRSLQLGSTSSATGSLGSQEVVVVGVFFFGSLNSPLPELAPP